jgi:hypothetical protein
MPSLYPLIWIVLIICLFLTWFFSHRANHKERMMRIESGSADIEGEEEKKTTGKSLWIRITCLVTGLSLGLLLIAILAGMRWLDRWGNAFPLAILGLFGGAGMFAAYYLENPKRKQ